MEKKIIVILKSDYIKNGQAYFSKINTWKDFNNRGVIGVYGVRDDNDAI